MVAYSFNKRFINPIRVGLSKVSLSFDCPPKRQTIRAIGKRRHARPGETLQLYHGMRTRQCELIGVARCTDVGNVKMVIKPRLLCVAINGAAISGDHMDEFAQADGFRDTEDMMTFWETEHPGVECFEGVLVLWEPL